MSLARFHVPTAAPGARVELPEHAAHHAREVLRLRSGAAVRVFDGAGGEYEAVLDEVSRRTVSAHLGAAARATRPESPLPIVLAVSPLKGDRMELVVQKATELGVAEIWPVITYRTDAAARPALRGSRGERWDRVASGAAEQCGRAVVPKVAPTTTLGGLVARPFDGTRIALLETEGHPPLPSLPVNAAQARAAADRPGRRLRARRDERAASRGVPPGLARPAHPAGGDGGPRGRRDRAGDVGGHGTGGRGDGVPQDPLAGGVRFLFRYRSVSFAREPPRPVHFRFLLPRADTAGPPLPPRTRPSYRLCRAVIAATSAKSCTEQPRDTSLTGLFSPWKIGPNAAAPPEPLGDLVGDVARVEVREDEDVGLAAERAVRALLLRDGGHDRGVELDLAVDEQAGLRWRTSATASFMRSIDASLALSRVEKDRNATRGSWPKARALAAVARPISASVSASGAMFIEQSA